MGKGKRISENSVALLFVTPAIFVFISVIIVPILLGFGLSFTEYNIFRNTASWLGPDHYIEIFKDKVFWWALRNNIFVAFVSVFIQIPIGFGLAYVVYRRFIKFGPFFKAMIFLPITMSTVVVGTMWAKIFSPVGFVTEISKLIFNNQNIIDLLYNKKQLSMVPIALVIIWMSSGFYMVVFLANLKKLDSSIIEAAGMDGANEMQTLFRVVVPSMSGVIFTMVLISIVTSLKSFDLIYAMTKGGPGHFTEVLAVYMYNNTFGDVQNFGYGAAISSILVLFSIALMFLFRFVKQKVLHEE